MADFGQSNFGQSILASPLGRQFGPVHFWPIHVCVVLVFLLFFAFVVVVVVLVVGLDPPLDHPTPNRPKFRFFPLSCTISFFFSLSLGVFSFNFGGV